MKPNEKGKDFKIYKKNHIFSSIANSRTTQRPFITVNK